MLLYENYDILLSDIMWYAENKEVLIMNPYIICPTYDTKNLHLRLVMLDDAYDLLNCYSDLKAVKKMNVDNCTSDFYYATLKQMQDAIAFWLYEYEKKKYVRFSIVPKEYGKAVGTVEMFGSDFSEIGRAGVLRIDLASEYETPSIVSELIELSIGFFMTDFDVDTIFMKASHTPERAKILETYGFAPTDEFRPEGGYYIFKNKGIAYCGLACCVCSENKFCPGCQAGGCDIHGWCKNYKCCSEKGLSGCWECIQFPCEGGMLDKPRVRAFAQFAKEYGTNELISGLMKNKANGIVYHYDNQLVGDYDKCETKDEIFAMIKSTNC